MDILRILGILATTMDLAGPPHAQWEDHRRTQDTIHTTLIPLLRKKPSLLLRMLLI
jgi:hypothetical protein